MAKSCRTTSSVLATGSNPFVPQVPGATAPTASCTAPSKTWKPCRRRGAKARSGVVIGGGLLGLECAKALRDMGLETHVVEFAPRLMAVQVDEGGGRVLQAQIERLGVQVHTGRNTQQITDGARARHRMVFADGSHLEADMVGLLGRHSAARRAGAAMPAGHWAARGGIAIDSACRTSDHDVYAIGECASWNEQTFGLVAPGYDMARVAARHIAGDAQAAFTGADMSTKLKLMGVDVASIGDAHGKTPAQPKLPVRGRTPPGLQEDRHQRRRQAIAGRGVDWRCG